MLKKGKINPMLIIRLLGIALFIIIISKVEFKLVLQNLKNLNYNFFLIGVFFQILVLTFKGLRWHIMIDGRHNKKYWFKSFGQFFESYAIGVVTPGRIGELLKVGHEKNKNDKINSFLRIVSERGFDVSLFLFIATGALLWGDFIRINIWYSLLLFFLSCSLFIFSYLLLSSKKVLLSLQKIVNRFPNLKSTLELTGKQYSQKKINFHSFFIYFRGDEPFCFMFFSCQKRCFKHPIH
ncbi:MAG: flippase-like domain-containing protein [bacterium]